MNKVQSLTGVYVLASDCFYNISGESERQTRVTHKKVSQQCSSKINSEQSTAVNWTDESCLEGGEEILELYFTKQAGNYFFYAAPLFLLDRFFF